MSNDFTAAKNTLFRKNLLINCRGKLVDLSNPSVMGILNLTPDSFYTANLHSNYKDILNEVEKMVKDGAQFIDIGAVSSKPGAVDVDEDEELSRLLPILEKIIIEFPDLIISIDTFRSSVARASLEMGASIINDIYAGMFDKKNLDVAAEFSAPIILIHMQKNPSNMQLNPSYDNVTLEVTDFLSERAFAARSAGVKDIIIDPGFGFGKSISHNYQLLNQLKYVSDIFEFPLLVGVSRKSMISKLLGIKTKETLNGTTAVHMLSLLNGANILRVHDVKEAAETVLIFNEYQKQAICQ